MFSSLIKIFSLFDKQYKSWLPLLLVSNLLAMLLELISIGAVPILLSVIAKPDILTGYGLQINFSVANKTQLILIGGGIFIAVFVIRSLFIIVNQYLQQYLAQRIQIKLAEKLFSLYMHAPYTFHLQRNSSELITNVKQGALFISFFILTPLLQLIQHSLFLIAIISLLFFTEPLITLFSIFLFGGFSLFFLYKTNQLIKQYGIKNRSGNQQTLQVLQQGLAGFKEIIILGKQTYFIENFSENAKILSKAQMMQQVVSSLSPLLLEILAVISLVGIALGLSFKRQDMTSIVALLGLFAMAFMRLRGSFTTVLQNYNSLVHNLAFVEPVYQDFMLLSGTLKNSSQQKEIAPFKFKDSLRVENLSFRYPGTEKPVLEHLNLTIKKGTSVALVGPSGAGKTTLADILLGILLPTEGRVLVDGKDIQENLAGWQKDIGYVPQFIYLIDDTLRRNIAFGLETTEINQQQLDHTLTVAQLKTFVETLPQTLDTVVGENGVRLSGGQRQRVGIARALYDNPDILFLDEATSALDNVTEKEIINLINKLKGERTLVIIAHRLTTVQHCDILFLLDKGKLVGAGSYAELLQSSPLFRKMAQHPDLN